MDINSFLPERFIEGNELYRFLDSLEREHRNSNNQIKSLDQLINCREGKVLNDQNMVSLKKFKEKNVNKFYEDILYYCSSPEDLKNYKRSTEEEKNYEFFKDLESEEFLACQNKRNEDIKNIQKLSLFIK